jgi:hypothetical protein
MRRKRMAKYLAHDDDVIYSFAKDSPEAAIDDAKQWVDPAWDWEGLKADECTDRLAKAVDEQGGAIAYRYNGDGLLDLPF